MKYIQHNPQFINGYPAPCEVNGQDVISSPVSVPVWETVYRDGGIIDLPSDEVFKNYPRTRKRIKVFDGYRCLGCGIIIK